MSEQVFRRIIEAASATIDNHAEELTDLDRAIGDGDHGVNMKRGFNAIAEISDEIAAMPFGQAMQKAGMTLVMKVGGASGPLFGSLLMAMGKAQAETPGTVSEIAETLAAGVEAVKARGKSDVGAKTMLDVLAPLVDALQSAGDDASDIARSTVDQAVAATKDMQATKGRASFLGERSVGHVDPGAQSSAYLVHAVCDALEAA